MRDKILKIVYASGKNGILQEELTKNYGISKSTVSTVLSSFERENIVIRKRVAGRSYRIWHTDFSPFPVKGVIRIGILKAIEYPAIFLCEDILKDIDVRVKIYRDAFSLTKDLAEGYLEIACSPLITQVLFSLVYRSIIIKAGCGFNGGGLIIKKSVPKIFGSTELSTMEFSLRKYIEMQNLEYEEIRYFSSPEKMISVLNSGDVDAIAIWEPYLTDLGKKYKIIRFSELFGEYPCCTLACNDRIEKSEEFQKFISAYRYAVDNLQELKDRAIELQAKMLKYPASKIRQAFDGYAYDWRLDMNHVMKILEEYGIKLTRESTKKVFRLQ